MMSGNNNQVYINDLKAFKDQTLTRLKDIIQQVGENKAVHLKIEAIQADMNRLAIQTGKTQEDKYIELQTALEDMLKDRLLDIIHKYETNGYRQYFDTVAQTILELKKFEIPEPVGAMVYAGCEVISRRKL